jgi:hypothetical protein
VSHGTSSGYAGPARKAHLEMGTGRASYSLDDLGRGGAFSSREVQGHEAIARTAWQCTIVLALAPRVIGGILRRVRWWTWASPTCPEGTE